jgi:quercetin dioxygenase-like cupin family protein
MMDFVLAETQPENVEWYLADDIFVKQMLVAKAGSYVPQHSHEFDHVSMLAVGSVTLWKDGVLDRVYHAPTGIAIKAGVKHLFRAEQDGTLIFCIHNVGRAGYVEILEEHQLVKEA